MSTNYPDILEICSPESVEIGIRANTFSFTSYSNVTQAAPQAGALWEGSVSYTLTPEEKRNLKVFIQQLNGRAGRFKINDPTEPTYPEMGTPNVNQPNQTGTVLTTQGWTPNCLVLRKGQYFNINNELKCSSADIYSSIDGTATLNFIPAIRNSPALATPINTSKPYMLATLNDDYIGFKTNENFVSKVSFEFTEAIYERE